MATLDVEALRKRFKHTVVKMRFIMRRKSPIVQTVTIFYKGKHIGTHLEAYAAAVIIKRDKRTRRGRLYNPKRIYKRLHRQPHIYCVARVIKYGWGYCRENRYYGNEVHPF